MFMRVHAKYPRKVHANCIQNGLLVIKMRRLYQREISGVESYADLSCILYILGLFSKKLRDD